MKRHRSWPNIYSRNYASGAVSYVVDLGINKDEKGKRRERSIFQTKAEANDFAKKCRQARRKYGDGMTALPFEVMGQAKRFHDLLRQHGLTFDEAYRDFEEKVIPFLSAPNVAEIGRRFLEQQAGKGNRPSTVSSGCNFVGRFAAAFGTRQLKDITEEELRGFCFKPEYAPKTKRNLRALAAQLYRFAILKKWVSDNTALQLETPRLPEQPEFLKVEQVQRLLAAAEKFGVLGYVLLAVFAGIRPDEVSRLDWADVHIDDRVICIVGAAAKIHLRREVPIHDTLLAWLMRCRREKGLIVEGAKFDDRLREARAAAGIIEWPNDVLRHTFATNHAAAFKDHNETARQMGHIGGLIVLRKHYVAYVPEKEAKKFWELTPASVVPTPTGDS